MIKRRTGVMLMLSLIFGGAAVYMARQWVDLKNSPIALDRANETVVVIASMDIPLATKLQEQHLTTVVLPRRVVSSGAFENIEDVTGKVARGQIFKGEILNTARLASHAEGSTLAAIIEPKKRAVTIRSNDIIGVAGFLLPGNRVDVLASKKVKKEAKVTTVLKDIKVLAVDQTARTDKNDPVIVRAVTLELLPKEAEKIVKATDEGKVQLALRNPLEEEVIITDKPVRKIVARRKKSNATYITVIKGIDVRPPVRVNK